MPESA